MMKTRRKVMKDESWNLLEHWGTGSIYILVDAGKHTLRGFSTMTKWHPLSTILSFQYH